VLTRDGISYVDGGTHGKMERKFNFTEGKNQPFQF